MYNPSLMAAESNIHISKAFFFQVPKENPIHFKPLEARMDNTTYDQLLDVTQHGQNIDQTAIARLSRNIIAPSYNSHGVVDINGGWDEHRFAYVLEFTIQPPGSLPNYREMVMGYTNYAGITSSGVVDPNMVLSVNNTVRLADQVYHTTQGVQRATSVTDNVQVLNPIKVTAGVNTVVASNAMRPADALYTAQLINSYGNQDHMGDNQRTIISDMRKAIQPKGIASSYYNNSSAEYIGNIARCHRDVLRSNEHDGVMGGYSDSEIMGNTANLLAENMLVRSATLGRMLDQSQMEDTGVVTIGELERVFGAFLDDPNRTNISMLPPNQTMVNMSDVTSHWGGSTQETNLAHALSNLVPAIMSRNLSLGYGFTLTNRTPDGQPSVATTSFIPLVDLPNQEQFVQRIEAEIMTRVIPELFSDGTDYWVEMTANLANNSSINISLYGNPFTEYSAPNYCSSLSTSVVSADPLAAQRIGSVVSNIVEINKVASAANTNIASPF